jgi:hypothetical protein
MDTPKNPPEKTQKTPGPARKPISEKSTKTPKNLGQEKKAPPKKPPKTPGHTKNPSAKTQKTLGAAKNPSPQ